MGLVLVYLGCRINVAESEEQWLQGGQEVITCRWPVLIFRIRK